MSQKIIPSCRRIGIRRLTGYLSVLAAFLLTIAAQHTSAQAACNVIYTISPQNTSQFGAALTIQNTGTTAWTSWTLTWSFANGQTVSQLWNGIETQSGAAVTVRNESYNGSIAAGASYTGVGFNGTWNGTTNAVPSSFAVNGVPCGAATGSFSLKPSATSLSITQGASGTDTITITDVSPFAGNVTLAATGLPSGVTATFGANPTTGSSVVTFTASPTATVGTSSVIIAGASGSLNASTTIALTVTAKAGFAIAPASALSVTQGKSATDTITITRTGGFTGSITLAISGLPSGVACSFGTNPATTSSILTCSASATAAAGSYTVSITGTSGTTTATTTLPLNVVSSAGSFTLKPSAATLSIAQGASGTDTITVTDISPFAGAVTLAASGLPTGVTSSFATNPATSTSVLTLTASGTAAVGLATITITGTSGTLTATTTISLTVTGSPSFTVAPSATALTLSPNSSGTDTITATDLNGFTGSISCSISGLPTGVTATFNPNPFTTSSVITLTSSSAALPGTYIIIITCTSGTLTKTTAISLTVTGSPGFTITPSAASLSIAPNSSGTDTITVSDVNGFAGSVTLAATGLPAGVTAAFTTNPTTGASIVTFTVASSATAGTSNVTITGNSGTLTATTAISLTVTGSTGANIACNVVYTISPSGNDTFGVTPTINNTGKTAWTSWVLTWTFANGQTITDLWGGVLTQTGANVSIAAESYDGAVAAGGSVAQVGFIGTWNGVTNAIPKNFAINGTTCSSTGGSGFTLGASASPLVVSEGSSSSDTITVSDFGGFTGSVTLAASGLPAGVTAAFSTNPTTGSSVVTFTAMASLPAQTATVTITGTSGTTTATTTVSLVIAGYSTVAVNSTAKGNAVTNQILGMNMSAWYDIVTNETAVVGAFQTAGIKAVRWPGGSWSDVYHWSTNTNCFSGTSGVPDAVDTFTNFVNDLAIPAGLDVALTANYGTDPTCTTGGQPSEAAAWVTAALADGITVSHMTVGNEVYGSWEEDLHALKNNAATYAAAVVGSSGYYQAIKAASPKTLVGVAVDADNTAGGWDNTVLANAKGSYDFVEYHYYPETPGQENDTTLIDQDAQQLTTNINTIRAELAEWGTPNTPIYVGEIGGPYSAPGKQSMSITQALYAGQVLGEMMNDGVSRLTWWIGFGGCADASYGANFSSSLYGWQDFGGYMVFSDGLTDYYQCTAETLAPGVLLPTARAFQLFSNVAVTGENVLSASVTGDTADVVAYAATHSGGTALVLFNRNETASQPVVVTLTGQTTATSATVETYDKAIYDLSGSPTGVIPDPAGTSTWAGPTTTTITSPTLPLSLTLPPWSMNVVIIH